MLSFLGLESWATALVAVASGSALGIAFGFIPGVGGRIGLILSLPLATFFPPYESAIFLFAMHAVVNTSGAIPNIAFGIPSSSADLATIIDGHPLAKMGRAGEALGASLSASAIGGVIGAVVFLLAIPIARPLVTSFGPPEFLFLSVFSLTLIASISKEGLLAGLIVVAFGILVSTVGVDGRSGDPRFAFGWLQLWDGIELPALVCGLFVVPEMLALTSLAADAETRAVSTSIADVFRGMFVTFRHMRVVLVSSLYGILVGVAPAIGSSVSAWMSYDYAARTTKSDIPFGKGAVAGVIAPEAANNSEEGGAMIPSLFFGIPGSSSMAILIAVLGSVGVAVGPNLLTRDIGLSFSLAGAVLLSNLIAVPFFFMVIPTLVRISALRREAMMPIAIALSIAAAFIDAPTLLTLFLLVVGSAIGIALRLANWPRAPFIVGFVIGKMAENAYYLTVDIYGWSALSRPIVIVLGAATIAWLVYVIRSRPIVHVSGHRPTNLVVSGGLMAIFAAAIVAAVQTIAYPGNVTPIAVSIFGGLLCLVVFAVNARAPSTAAPEPMKHVLATALFAAAIPFFGVILSSIGFIAVVLSIVGIRRRNALATGVVFGGLQLALLSAIYDLPVEKELIGRIPWLIFGH